MKGSWEPGFVGIYEVREAARYLAVTTPKRDGPITSQTMLRWIRSGLALPAYRGVRGRELLIEFEDLVTMRMVARLRSAGFSLQHIRKVENWLRSKTKYPRPFAIKPVWFRESDIFSELEGYLLSISRCGQHPLDFIKESIVRVDMTFDRSLVARSWEPHSDVLLDPRVQCGEPCIGGTRVPTRAIWSMVVGGDSPAVVAMSYEIEESQVRNGLEWERRLAAV